MIYLDVIGGIVMKRPLCPLRNWARTFAGGSIPKPERFAYVARKLFKGASFPPWTANRGVSISWICWDIA